MTHYDEADYLALSGIQHFAFCRRQWALIHIEQIWRENILTTEGALLHERVHDEMLREKRNDIIVSRGMKIFSRRLGISGVCDAVEFHRSEEGITLSGREGSWQAIPVEYKRGKPKTDDIDELQLCAQAICLEEMLACEEIAHGYLFYAQPRRREEVPLTQDLRQKVDIYFREMHQLFERGYTPKVKPRKGCQSCSIASSCLPKLNKNLSATAYLYEHLGEVEE